MENKVILSICIPTYNNAEDLYTKVCNLLKVISADIQIVISDNHSNDKTFVLFSEIRDKRVKYVRLPENKGSIFNSSFALNLADGIYAMLLMDKDYVKTDYLDSILCVLRNKTKTFDFGYFTLDIYQTAQKKIKEYHGIINNLKTFAYTCNHPSGIFFKTELIKSINPVSRFTSIEEYGPFVTGYVFTESCFVGEGCIINIPFVYTVKPPFNGKKHSETYSTQKNNIYFEPNQRFTQLQKFINHLKTLNITKYVRIRMLKILIRDTFFLCTDTYSSILKMKNICDWYNVPLRNIEIQEIKIITTEYIHNILKMNSISTIEKFIFLNMLIVKSKLNISEKFKLFFKCFCELL